MRSTSALGGNDFPGSHAVGRWVTVTQLPPLESKESQTPFHRVMGRIRTVVITGFGRAQPQGRRRPAFLRPRPRRRSQPDDPTPTIREASRTSPLSSEQAGATVAVAPAYAISRRPCPHLRPGLRDEAYAGRSSPPGSDPRWRRRPVLLPLCRSCGRPAAR